MSPETTAGDDSAESLLLAIMPEQDTAAAIETHMREAGQNVRVDWLSAPARLGQYLQDNRPALLCCQHGDHADEELQRLVSICLEAAPDTPVVAIGGDPGADRRVALIQAGARDLVDPNDPALLAATLTRELRTARLRHEAEDCRRRAAQLERRLEDILAESQEARATLQEGIHAGLNPPYAQLFGFDSAEELEGVPLMDLVAPPDRDRVKKKLADCSKGKDGGALQFTARRADDSSCHVTMRCRPVQVDGEEGVELLVAQGTTPTAPTTGDREARTALYDALARQSAGTADTVLALLYISVDDLEGLQERLGLPKADRVLDELALFLLESTGEEDRCFRFSTGEFVILASHDSMQGIQTLGEELRAAVDAEVFGDEGTSASLTVSVATAGLGEASGRQDLLLSVMQRAREVSAGGGNQVVLEAGTEQELAAQSSEKQWLQRLQWALKNDGFGLALQPIASLEGDNAQHYDVLPRLISEEGEILRSPEFIEAAERHGLAPQLDRWVTRKVLQTLRERGRNNERGMYFVRLSDATLDSAPDFLTWLGEQLREFEINPDDMRFCVSEDSLRSHIRRAQQLADGLRELKMAISIDRYATTGKSVQLLQRVTADFAKLDAKITEDLAGDEGDPRVAEAVKAARDQGLKLIAQQVADANTMARLWQLGISYIQLQLVQEPEQAPGTSVA